MKNYLVTFVAVLIMFTLNSCTEEEDLTVKFNWEFTITAETTVSPEFPGYPQTITTTVTENNLTEAEAELIVKENTTTISQSQSMGEFGTITMTVKTTCTKKKLI